MEENQFPQELYELYLKNRVCDYIIKKSKEVTAEQLIYAAQAKGFDESDGDIRNIIDRTYEMGKGHGMIQAKAELLRELAEFFELPKTIRENL